MILDDLLNGVQHVEALQRLNAVIVLGTVDEVEAIPTLIECFKNEREPDVRQSLAWAGKRLQSLRQSGPPAGKIRRDDLVRLPVPATRAGHPARRRRSVALVEVDGPEVELTFLTNHRAWAASSVGALDKERWPIEVFFKQIKQTLQLADFGGHRAAAVRWQVWTARRVDVLLRLAAVRRQWGQSFVRRWAVRRASQWRRLDVAALRQSSGTAPGRFANHVSFK